VLNLVYLEPASFNRVKPGELTIEGARIFVQQFSNFTRSFPHWLTVVATNCPLPEVRKFFASNVYGEEVGSPGEGSHYDLLVRQGEALGLTREAIEQTAPLPTTSLAINALEGICRNRPWLEGLAATTGLECINHPEVRGRSETIIINDIRSWKHLGLNDQQLRSRSVHMEEDEKHVDMGLAILAEHASTEKLEEKGVRSAYEAVFAFRVLMDGIGRAALGSNP
jgi:pyrroloquinoline quinone (PQQ) biosynthesis protein C